MEFEVYADDGFNSCSSSNNTFCQRNIYAGLSSKTYGMLYGQDGARVKNGCRWHRLVQ